jgi:hypothetical protein
MGLVFGFPGFPLTLALVLLLFVGGRVAVGAGAFLLVLIVRMAFVRLEATAEGVLIVNRFFRHRIAWADLNAVWSTRTRRRYEFPVVAFAPRHLPWFQINAYATLGLDAVECADVVCVLYEMAERSGHPIAAAVDQDEIGPDSRPRRLG